jgi:hypothetical protein
MTTPDGLSDAAFDRIYYACGLVRLNDYTPYILHIVITEVLLQTHPALAAFVRRLEEARFQGLLDSLRARRVACSFGGVG